MNYSVTGVLFVAVLALGVMSFIGFDGDSTGNSVNSVDLRGPRVVGSDISADYNPYAGLSVHDCLLASEIANMKTVQEVEQPNNRLYQLILACDSKGWLPK